MAGYGYPGFGNMYGGFGGGNMYGGFGGGNLQQTFEQERVGFGPNGYGMYEQDVQVNRSPFTGATQVVRENEFMPMGGNPGYGYGGFPGNRFY